MNYTLLFYLIAAHFLFDFPLQGDFVGKGKNHNHPIPDIPWYTVLISHAFLHGAAVALLTGIPFLGLSEILIHFSLDFLKNELNETSSNKSRLFNVDQILHILCKVFYVTCLMVAKQHA